MPPRWRVSSVDWEAEPPSLLRRLCLRRGATCMLRGRVTHFKGCQACNRRLHLRLHLRLRLRSGRRHGRTSGRGHGRRARLQGCKVSNRLASQLFEKHRCRGRRRCSGEAPYHLKGQVVKPCARRAIAAACSDVSDTCACAPCWAHAPERLCERAVRSAAASTAASMARYALACMRRGRSTRGRSSPSASLITSLASSSVKNSLGPRSSWTRYGAVCPRGNPGSE